jgi:hypothetical protein
VKADQLPDCLQLAEALSCAAARLMSARSLDEALQSVVGTAPSAVPGVDCASISILERGGRFETIAASDDLARQADEARYRPGTFLVAWAELVDQPGPARFVHPPQDVPGQAAMTVQLTVNRRAATVVNLYSARIDGFGQDDRRVAYLFATHARMGLARARAEHDFRQALNSRKEIGRAIGIVMERYQLSEERAFEFLVRISRSGNVKLRDVASRVVAETDRAHADATEPSLRAQPSGEAAAGAGCCDLTPLLLR